MVQSAECVLFNYEASLYSGIRHLFRHLCKKSWLLFIQLVTALKLASAIASLQKCNVINVMCFQLQYSVTFLLQVAHNSGGNSNLYGNETMTMSPQQHHQSNFSHHQYQPRGGVDEQVLANNLNADMLSNCQPGVETIVKDPNNYGKFLYQVYKVLFHVIKWFNTGRMLRSVP